MRDVFRLATAMLSVLALTGCAARMTVSSHVEPGLDWSRYRTFDWGPATLYRPGMYDWSRIPGSTTTCRVRSRRVFKPRA